MHVIGYFLSLKKTLVCQDFGSISAHLCMIAFWLGKEPQESSWILQWLPGVKKKRELDGSLSWDDMIDLIWHDVA